MVINFTKKIETFVNIFSIHICFAKCKIEIQVLVLHKMLKKRTEERPKEDDFFKHKLRRNNTQFIENENQF